MTVAELLAFLSLILLAGFAIAILAKVIERYGKQLVELQRLLLLKDDRPALARAIESAQAHEMRQDQPRHEERHELFAEN
jgi:hypothetical protein